MIQHLQWIITVKTQRYKFTNLNRKNLIVTLALLNYLQYLLGINGLVKNASFKTIKMLVSKLLTSQYGLSNWNTITFNYRLLRHSVFNTGIAAIEIIPP